MYSTVQYIGNFLVGPNNILCRIFVGTQLIVARDHYHKAIILRYNVITFSQCLSTVLGFLKIT